MFDAIGQRRRTTTRDSSYGKHPLAGVVTPWLTARFARPTTCDYSAIVHRSDEPRRTAGYNTASYQKFVYVFPSLPGCGWSGLGGGSQAWINQSPNLLVVGHELGHTFGLGHRQPALHHGGVTVPIDGACTRSEYGDPAGSWATEAAHFPAPHKDELGYLRAGHREGAQGRYRRYTIAPLESAGGSTVRGQGATSRNRTYWLE